MTTDEEKRADQLLDQEKRELEEQQIQAEKDASDHRTLDDMKRDDIDALKALLARKQYEHWFTSAEKALEFIGIALFSFLDRRLKIKVKPNMVANPGAHKFLDKLLRKNGVTIEQRPYEEQEDSWRSGLYVYKNDELAAFVGHGHRTYRSQFSIDPEYRVITTVET